MSHRAQTTLDFAIGMGTFLLAVAFLMGLAPGLLDPFTGNIQEETAAADRIASQLAEGTLAAPGDPHVLDAGCTAAFFDDGSADGCGFAADATLSERVGLTSHHHVNVSVRHEGRVVCLEDYTHAVTACPGDVRLETSTTGSVPDEPSITAHRTVSLDGESATLVVQVW